MTTASSRQAKNVPAAASEPPVPLHSSSDSRIRVGRRPLQGMKALVRMAASRSRGLSMMRQPMTPQALQPSPMHMVRLCRPLPPAARKKRSQAKAMRGSSPASSSRVNRGKKMAMGGSITATTQAAVR